MESSFKTADIQYVKFHSKVLKTLILIFVISFIPSSNMSAYMCKYKEDFYKLYHIHYQQYPDDCMENIYWLEQAVRADFANPLYAKAKITSEDQYEKYRYLFMMHLNLKLIEQHLRLGRIYDKKALYFYDAPWKDEYLANLKKNKSLLRSWLLLLERSFIMGRKSKHWKIQISVYSGTSELGRRTGTNRNRRTELQNNA